MSDLKIEALEKKEELTEFLRFYDDAYEYRSAKWPADFQFQLSILTGESPFARGRHLYPVLVRSGGKIVARATGMMDDHYNKHWNSNLGHVCWFEALPGAYDATKLLMDHVCRWLQGQGAVAARTGFSGLDFPFVIDDYESLPPRILRHNPAYYHSLLKDSGFESEQGFVDYKITVRPEWVDLYQEMLDACRHGGYEIVSLAEVPHERGVEDFTSTYNDAFKAHWGWTPFTEAEVSYLFKGFEVYGALETCVMAYKDDEPVGLLLLTPERSSDAVVKEGRTIHHSEKLNVLAICVRESDRRRGVNLAMAARGYLELIGRGAKTLSYTLVLDHNWPSRRTGEKLGGRVCSNYMAYRRNF